MLFSLDNKFNSSPKTGKRYYPTKSHGNNPESPNYLQLCKVYNNSLITEKVIHTEHNVSKEFATNSKLDNLKFMIKKPKKFDLTPEVHESKIVSISPVYLNNINEYNIKESFNVDDNRLIKYTSKPKEEYNCILDRIIKHKPTEMKADKWPLFYEK